MPARLSAWEDSAKCWPRYENYVEFDPQVKDAWGVPVLRFHINFGDNEKKMAADMSASAKEMFEEAGIQIIGHRPRNADAGLVHSRTGHGAHGERS